MSDNRNLPPSSRLPHGLMGMEILGYTVCDWCPTPDGTGPAEAVALALQVRWNRETQADLVMRLKTPDAVDQMIAALERHRNSVWPWHRSAAR